jgi:DNA-nicking Smr family endonuclease
VTDSPFDDDASLFREAMSGVVRLESDKAEFQRSRPGPEPSFTRAEVEDVLRASLESGPDPGEVETGDELSFRRDGLPATVYRKLRRGRYRIGAELDLHGLTAVEAHQAVHEFLQESSRQGSAVVRIIHGKGLGSGPGGPVIKRRVGRWLRHRDEVLAYCSARPIDGGTGALYVLIRT